jgi:hypothetical protein
MVFEFRCEESVVGSKSPYTVLYTVQVRCDRFQRYERYEESVSYLFSTCDY